MFYSEKTRPSIKPFVPNDPVRSEVGKATSTPASPSDARVLAKPKGAFTDVRHKSSQIALVTPSVQMAHKTIGSKIATPKPRHHDADFTVSYTGIPRKFDDRESKTIRNENPGGISLDERKRMRDERIKEKKEKKGKIEEVVPTRDEICHTMFMLFAKYEFITCVDIMRAMELNRDSNKAKTAVKCVLREFALYESSGPNKRKYKMRDAYKIKKKDAVVVAEEDDVEWESVE